ncbi:MAG: type II secretion system inner membrane protein GspF [Deltaproteobacteria bacterium]|nr:MAG: type II secretion system inner membrane protein GspF [Deltaproteobacteria bacterium]
MPVYEYTALDKAGKSKTGIIDADSAVAARQKLRGTGIFPVEVKETTARPKDQPSGPVAVSTLFKRVRPGELSVITRQLSTLLGAGITLVSALEALITQAPNPLLKKIMAQIKESVNEGNSLAFSLSQHPKVFSQIYINMVRAGEASGSLDLVLDRLAEYAEHQQALRGRVQAALAYPIFMFFIGTLVLLFLVAVVVPQITKVFSDMHQTLPLPTVILISVSEFLKTFWWLLLAGLVAAIILVKQFRKTPRGSYIWDEIKIRVPMFGSISLRLAIARFGRTLGNLLDSGVPLLTALQIVRNIVNNVLIADVIDKTMDEIQAGKSLAAPLSRSTWFPPMAIQMISVGEQSGALEKMLNKIADIYEREAESRITVMTSMLEPIMILVMALVVGFMLVSILLPIFEMNQLIK